MTKLSNFLASVKLTVVLLIVLAVLSVVGTVIPQQEPPGIYVRMYGESTASLFRSLGFTNMYASPLFTALLGLLGANLVVCSLDRLPKTWKLVGNRPSLNPREYKQMPYRKEQHVKLGNPEWRTVLSGILSRRLGTIRENEFDGGVVFFSNRTPWARLGVYVVHSSILLLFAGGIVGAFGDSRTRERAGRGSPWIISSSAESPTPSLWISRYDATISTLNSMIPARRRSFVPTSPFCRAERRCSVFRCGVNHPVTFGGITFYLSSYGSTLGGDLVLELTDNRTGEVHTVKGPASADFTLPGGKGGFRIIDFQDNLVSRGMSFGPGVFVHLMGTGERTPPFWALQKFPQLDQRRGGKFTFALKSFEEVYYTGLQANRDPGVVLIYLGFTLMLIGFPITFFMSHRMIWGPGSKHGRESQSDSRGHRSSKSARFFQVHGRTLEEIPPVFTKEERRP
jgi:cytochrome c biogenesis protein